VPVHVVAVIAFVLCAVLAAVFVLGGHDHARRAGPSSAATASLAGAERICRDWTTNPAQALQLVNTYNAGTGGEEQLKLDVIEAFGGTPGEKRAVVVDCIPFR